MQLSKLVARHFYTPGYQKIIDEISNSCETCVALKQLPKEIFSESTGNIDGFGSHFSADVIERNQQHILIIREKLSSFTLTKFIPNQTAQTLKEALISLILDMVPHTGTEVQVDCATSWATLANDSNTENSQLKRLKIAIILGRHFNKNKNPVIDNACKEFHKESLRLKPDGGMLSEIERATITRNMNQRIRKSGLSSKEICFKRDVINNTEKTINDKDLAEDIIKDRKRRHRQTDQKPTHSIEIGHNVFLRNGKSKLKARELFRVTDIFSKDNEPWAIIQKHNSQFRSKKYEVKISELLLLPGQVEENLPNEECEQIPITSRTELEPTTTKKSKRKAAIKARELIARTHNIKQRRKPEEMLHGWDYERMMELWSWDEDNVIYFNENDFTENDEYLSTSTQSSTTDISEDTITQEIEFNLSDEDIPYGNGNQPIPETNEETTTKKIHSYQDANLHPDYVNMEQDPTPNIISLDQCQNLNEHLNLPNVIEAVAIGTSENTRLGQRASQRSRTGPNNYAMYHRTGKKHPSPQTMDAGRGER